MINQILNDLLQLGFLYIVFALAYSSNVVLSLYHNVSLSKKEFDKNKLFTSLIKGVTLVVGSILLVISIDVATIVVTSLLPDLANASELVTIVMVLATIGSTAIKYIIEAYKTFNDILNFKEGA